MIKELAYKEFRNRIHQFFYGTDYIELKPTLPQLRKSFERYGYRMNWWTQVEDWQPNSVATVHIIEVFYPSNYSMRFGCTSIKGWDRCIEYAMEWLEQIEQDNKARKLIEKL